MNQGESRISDVDVSAGRDLLTLRLLQSIGLTLILILGAFAALLLVREPGLRTHVSSTLAEQLANARAQSVKSANDAILKRIEALGQLPASVREQVARAAIPEALDIKAIPLDDLGTVRLSKGDYDLDSHIEIDLVSRAFNGEMPPPEAVRQTAAWVLVYARPFNDGTENGVLLAELPVSVVSGWLGETAEMRFGLVQRTASGAVQVFGAPLAGDRPSGSAQVGNSPWFVQVQVAPDWITLLLGNSLWLLIAAGVSLLGVITGGVMLMRGIPALLRQESDRILESAENKSALKVRVPALLPLARLLRQMALLSRRQLITAARKSSETQDVPVAKKEQAQPEQPATEALAAELEIDETAIEARDDGMPAHIFRSADIRGRTEDELTDSLVERISKALAVIVKRRGVQTLAIAHDGRPSSERLRTIVVKALLGSGRDVVDLGEAPTPLLYYATHETDYDSGIMITGGHSGDTTNGLRIVLQRELLDRAGIQEILEGVREGLNDQGSGRTIKLDVEADYLDKIALDIGAALPLNIIVDANYGAAAHLAREAFTALGCDVVTYNDPDGDSRPGEGWNLRDAIAALGEKVTAAGADVGLLYDGDGDRLHTVTNTGSAVATDQLMMILGRDVLARSPGADIVYDVQCTRHFAPFVTRSGGRAVICRSGHANVRRKMAQTDAIMGGEFSGHVFIKDRWYGFDDGVYAAARLVELLSTSSETFQELLSTLPAYLSSDELLVPLAGHERNELLKTLALAPDFPGSRVTTLDGLRIDYSDSWGLVQSSRTDEALSFRFEGNDTEAMQRVQAVLRKAIHSHLPELELPF